MRIRFNSEPSRFAPLIETALKGAPNALPEGHVVSIRVPIQTATKRGFERRVLATIGSDPDFFETDWKGPDASRFGARLRAAATVLRDLGYTGSFHLEHAGNTITIEMAKPGSLNR